MEYIGTKYYWEELSGIAESCLADIQTAIEEWGKEKGENQITLLQPIKGYESVALDGNGENEDVVLVDIHGNKESLWEEETNFIVAVADAINDVIAKEENK